MKRSALFAALLLAVAGPALAQTPPAPATPAAPRAAPAAPAAMPAPSELTKDGKPRMKDVRLQCRDAVKQSGVTGDARRQSMLDCMLKQRPDMEASLKCRADPALKGMEKSARHEAVKACLARVKSKG